MELNLISICLCHRLTDQIVVVIKSLCYNSCVVMLVFIYLFIYHLHSMDLLGIDPPDIGIVKYEQRIH